MTVSVYNSVDRIVKMAMFDAGLLEENADPTSEQQGHNVQRLADMMQIWQLEGCKLHLLRDVVMPLVLNQGVYNLGPGAPLNIIKPLRIESAYWVDAQQTTSREIFRVERYDWDRLPPAQANGTVTQFYEDRQLTAINLYLWNKPSATDVAGTLHLTVRVPGAGGIAGVGDPITSNFPIEWAMALRWGLAADLATGQPDSIVQRCERMAAYYKTILENYDVEQGGVIFQPDTSGQARSRFA